eukprot:COSAG04_NODE_3286_length_2972_cov_123.363035_2_plen_168_part_00
MWCFVVGYGSRFNGFSGFGRVYVLAPACCAGHGWELIGLFAAAGHELCLRLGRYAGHHAQYTRAAAHGRRLGPGRCDHQHAPPPSTQHTAPLRLHPSLLRICGLSPARCPHRRPAHSTPLRSAHRCCACWRAITGALPAVNYLVALARFFRVVPTSGTSTVTRSTPS